MGRKKKYLTKEEKKKANSIKSLKYYYKNKDKINKNRMEKYYANKEMQESIV